MTAALLLLGPSALGAQWRADVELGGSRVDQPSMSGHAAATALGAIEYLRPGAQLLGSTAHTLPDDGRVRSHAMLAAMLHTSPLRRVGVEVSGLASAYDDGVFARQLSGMLGARVRARAGRVGVWAGAGAGSFDDGDYRYPLTLLEAGATTDWRRARFTLAAVRNATLGEPRIEFVDDPPLAVTVRDRVAYTDASLEARSGAGRAEVTVRGVGRIVHRTIAYEDRPPARFTGSVDASWRFTGRTSLFASVGHELADLTRGLPESRYVAAGVRVRLRDTPPRRHVPLAPREAPGAPPDVLIERGAPGGTYLRVLAGSSARTVEVAATFTDWAPVTLTPDGSGAWTLGAPLASGPHRLMIRVDGGDWQPPANVPSIDDGLGARVGLVTIP